MEKKELYVKRMNDQLDEWRAKVDELRARANKKGSDFVIKNQGTLDNLTGTVTEAQTQLNKIKNDTGSAWEELKKGLDVAFTEIKTAFERASAKFSQ